MPSQYMEFLMLTQSQAAVAKGMRCRGDYNHHIAAWLATNQGRPSELNTGDEYPDLPPAPPKNLPPRGAPVAFLKDAISAMKRASSMLDGEGGVQHAKKTLDDFVNNITRGTDFFDSNSFI